MPITLSETAINEVNKAMALMKLDPKEHSLRVGVMGGCSGIQYQLGFDKRNEGDPLNDVSYTFGDLEVKITRTGDQMLDGTVIDFYNGAERSGFVFNNPNVKSGCGGGSCGSGGCGH